MRREDRQFVLHVALMVGAVVVGCKLGALLGERLA